MSLRPGFMRFKFPNFESLPSQPGDEKTSETKQCHGYKWELWLYPGGREEDADPDDPPQAGILGLFLRISGDKKKDGVKAKIAFTVRDADGNEFYSLSDRDARIFDEVTGSCGYDNVTKRSDILDPSNNILVHGTLIVDVELQVASPSKYQPSNNYAASFAKNTFKLYRNEAGSDISFKCGDTVIPAHKLILQMNAPILFNFCEKQGRGDAPILIGDTEKEIFEHVLRYVYGGGQPKLNDIREMGKELIVAADKYGIINLKMAVETALVDLRIVDVDTVVDWLLFADSKTCPLLKEYATAFISVRVKDVLDKEATKKLSDSPLLMKDLMIAISNVPTNYIGDADKMGVDELRMKLNEKDLDIDGSKRMLVSRLKDSNKRQRTE